MLKYIFKRILMMIPVLLGVLFLVFTMNEISPGDPAEMIAGVITPEAARPVIVSSNCFAKVLKAVTSLSNSLIFTVEQRASSQVVLRKR